eukprot:s3739_g10.t1
MEPQVKEKPGKEERKASKAAKEAAAKLAAAEEELAKAREEEEQEEAEDEPQDVPEAAVSSYNFQEQRCPSRRRDGQCEDETEWLETGVFADVREPVGESRKPLPRSASCLRSLRDRRWGVDITVEAETVANGEALPQIDPKTFVACADIQATEAQKLWALQTVSEKFFEGKSQLVVQVIFLLCDR